MEESDHDRIVRLEEQAQSRANALRLQAIEYERRLTDLNHAHAHAEQARLGSVSSDKFEDYIKTSAEALSVALTRADEQLSESVRRSDARYLEITTRIAALETWRTSVTARAGVFLAVALAGGGILGAVISRVFG